MGYWQDFTNGANPLTLADVPTSYNLVAVAFGNADSTPGQVTFSLDSGLSSALGGYSTSQFISDIQTLHSRGQKVILSVGGQNGTISVDDATSASNFASSMYSIIQEYGFDGVDIDLENGVNPTYMASALEQLESDVGSSLIITLAPQTLDTQSPPATTGPGAEHQEHPHDDQHPVLQLGFDERLRRQPLHRGHRELHYRPGLHRIAERTVGLPGRPRAARLPLGRRQRLRIAVGGQRRAGLPGRAGQLRQLRAAGSYPGIRGAMTWSINWDASNGYNFADTVAPYLASLP